MKNKQIFLCLLIISLVSCINNNKIKYHEYKSKNGKYVLEIPTKVKVYKEVEGLMSFTDKNDNLFIIIQKWDKNLESFINDDEYKSKGYLTQRIYKSNNAIYNSYTKENSIVYDLYVDKVINDTKFVINVSSSEIDKDILIDIISHIKNTLDLKDHKDEKLKEKLANKNLRKDKSKKDDYKSKNYNDDEFKNDDLANNNDSDTKGYNDNYSNNKDYKDYSNQSNNKNKDKDNKINKYKTKNNLIEFATYSNKYFSIEYPKDWIYLENSDGMSDVYIGAEDGGLGFTVIHFPSDYILKELIDDVDANLKAAGMKLVENSQTTVCGVTAYKRVHTYRTSELYIKTLSYTFKIKNEVYNVKFGADPTKVDSNNELIEIIIKSLKIK